MFPESVSGYGRNTQAPNPRQLYLKWERTIVFKNNSKYDAMELKIIWPSNQPHLHLEIEKDGHLKAFDSLKKDLKAESYISREEIQKHSNDRFEYFMPVELRNLLFILSYKNEVGKRFYIRYKRNGSEEIVDKTPKLLKPKFKKQFCI